MVRLLSGLAYLALATQSINAVSIPDVSNDALSSLEERAPLAADILSPSHALERRKGGGGRGGGSSGGSSSGGSSSGGGGGRSSTSGGSTRAGSGPSRSFGRNGGYYGGGAAVPYNSGGRSPKGLIAGAVLAPVAILAIMPGLWLYGAYPYYYNNPYRFYNRTAVNRTRVNPDNDNDRRSVNLMIRQESTGANETLPVLCLCGEGQVCGCDENDDQTYINDLVGDGDYAKLNKSLVTVSDVNGTRTLVLNGTLPPGTTAPGGEDGAASALGVGQYAGYWAIGLTVMYAVFV